MDKVHLAEFPSISAFYVKSQSEADAVASEILNTIRPAEEQIFVDTETAALPEWKHEYTNRAIRYKPGLDPFKSYVRLVQLGFRDQVWLLDSHHIKDWTKTRTLLEHPDIWNWFVNAKFDYKQLLWSLDIVTSNIVDFMAAAKLMNFPSATLAALVDYFMNMKLRKDLQVSDWSVPTLSPEQLEYAAVDIAAMISLRAPVVNELKKRGLWGAFGIECGALAPAGEMELNGTRLDFEKHRLSMEGSVRTAGDLRAKIITQLRPSIPQLPLDLGGDFVTGVNLKSSKQLLDVLQKHGLDIEATNKTELRMKAVDHPITADVLAFKKADKLIDAFGETLRGFVHPVTGRIHADFHTLFTANFRFSSSQPNLQQIPRCTCPAGQPHTCARDWFIADEGFVYVMADYSAIEMVGAAVVAPDERLLDIFKRRLKLAAKKRKGESVSTLEERLADPHYVTGSIVTSKQVMDVTKGDRQNAKPVNFGFVYGQQPPGFRVFSFVQYGVLFTIEEATETRAKYFSREGYEGLARWHRRSKTMYKETAMVTSLSGHQMPLSYNANFDSFAGPAALNYQVSNPCAAGNKRGLALLYRELRPYMNKSKRWTGPMICRTVHDENHLEAPAHMMGDACLLLETAMKAGMDKVLKRDDLVHVEATAGRSWADKL